MALEGSAREFVAATENAQVEAHNNYERVVLGYAANLGGLPQEYLDLAQRLEILVQVSLPEKAREETAQNESDKQ